MAPKSLKLRVLGASWLQVGVLGPSWLQVGRSVGHLGSNLRVLEAIWEVLAENLEKPEGFQGFLGGPEVWHQPRLRVSGWFWPRGGRAFPPTTLRDNSSKQPLETTPGDNLDNRQQSQQTTRRPQEPCAPKGPADIVCVGPIVIDI